MDSFKSITDASISLFGRSGVGKSTIGNIIGESEPGAPLFEEGSGCHACTKAISSKTVLVRGGTLRLTLEDTIGFPDTNVDTIVPYYDRVVAALSQPRNAVFLVVPNDRQTVRTLGDNKALFRQFRSLTPKLVLIVNGCANLDRFTPAQKETKREEIIAQMREPDGLLDIFKDATGLVPDFELLSPDMPHLITLLDQMKDWMFMVLMHSRPSPSPLKGVRALRDEMENQIQQWNLADIQMKEAQLQSLTTNKQVETMDAAIALAKERLDSKEEKWVSTFSVFGKSITGYSTYVYNKEEQTAIIAEKGQNLRRDMDAFYAAKKEEEKSACTEEKARVTMEEMKADLAQLELALGVDDARNGAGPAPAPQC